METESHFTPATELTSRLLLLLTPISALFCFLLGAAMGAGMRHAFLIAVVVALMCFVPATLFRLRGTKAYGDLTVAGVIITVIGRFL